MVESFSKISLNPPLSQSPSLKLSASTNPNHKKPLFVRKPTPHFLALPNQKHRKNFTELIETTQTQVQLYLQYQPDQKKTRQDSKTIRLQRHTQNFKTYNSHQTSFISNKEIEFSPKKSTVDLLLGFKYIQRRTEQNNGQEGVASKAKKPLMCFRDFQIQQTINLDETSDKSLRNQIENNETIKILPKTQDKFYCDPAHRLENLLKGVSYSDFGLKYNTPACAQCKNIKRMNQLLNDKCAELQQQLQLKSEDISILSQKVQFLKKQKQTSKSEEIKLREQMYLKEIEIYQNSSARYENVRKQLSRVVQRIKYLEIENGVLSRYKQDCFQAQRGYDNIKQQNEKLKRKIHSISQMSQKYNKKKPNNEIGRKQYGVGKSPYFKLAKQEETISLELSQASYQYS